jgi:prophage regulatory protein
MERRMKMEGFPESGFVRLSAILRFVQISKSTFYKYVKDGMLPAPFKPSPGVALWRAEVIRSLFQGSGQ